MVPKPFSTAAIAIGEPMVVAGTTEDVVEQARHDLEQRLGLLEIRCREMLGQVPAASSQ